MTLKLTQRNFQSVKLDEFIISLNSGLTGIIDYAETPKKPIS